MELAEGAPADSQPSEQRLAGVLLMWKRQEAFRFVLNTLQATRFVSPPTPEPPLTAAELDALDAITEFIREKRKGHKKTGEE
ncbi:MAG: hypothetical protein M5U26_20945 [Planctomycetota bacterium]|nr:hypothetical protein [Planctomycetota bacterium]